MYRGFCHNCYPCTTGASDYFCSGNMEYGNSTRLTFYLNSCVLILHIQHPSWLTWVILFSFSISALCGLCNCIGFHSGLPFCTPLWALKCVSFHRHLFFDGFSLGISFQLLMVYSFFFVPFLLSNHDTYYKDVHLCAAVVSSSEISTANLFMQVFFLSFFFMCQFCHDFSGDEC